MSKTSEGWVGHLRLEFGMKLIEICFQEQNQKADVNYSGTVGVNYILVPRISFFFLFPAQLSLASQWLLGRISGSLQGPKGQVLRPPTPSGLLPAQ